MKIIEKIGMQAMMEQLAEESAELCQSALKVARILGGKNPTPNTAEEAKANLTEEIADVFLCVELLKDHGEVQIRDIQSIMSAKLKRWESRLEQSVK